MGLHIQTYGNTHGGEEKLFLMSYQPPVQVTLNARRIMLLCSFTEIQHSCRLDFNLPLAGWDKCYHGPIRTALLHCSACMAGASIVANFVVPCSYCNYRYSIICFNYTQMRGIPIDSLYTAVSSGGPMRSRNLTSGCLRRVIARSW